MCATRKPAPIEEAVEACRRAVARYHTPRSQVLVIRERMPGLNAYIDAERGHRYQASKLKKHWTEIVAFQARRQGLQSVRHYPVTVRCDWYEENRRRDVDNVRFAIKFVLDGLQAAGVIESDGQRHVAGLEDGFYVDSDDPRVVVTIVEAGE